MNVFLIPMLSDNFCYYVYRKEDINKGFFIDVSEPKKVEAFLTTFGISEPTYILTTHKHGDHSGGNTDMKAKYPSLQVIGGAHDSIPAVTQPVNDGDNLSVHQMNVNCMHTPCHTRGHILYNVNLSEDSPEVEQEDMFESSKVEGYQLVQNVNRCVFTGDTLFIGGCGRFFEGSAEQMLSALDRVATLPQDTKIFCGHEYTEANLAFCLKVEPSNVSTQNKIAEVKELRGKEIFTVPSVLRNELTYNVFMRCREADVQKIADSTNPVQVMHFLREFKNTGSAPKLQE